MGDVGSELTQVEQLETAADLALVEPSEVEKAEKAIASLLINH